jgi:mutator protein MutT
VREVVTALIIEEGRTLCTQRLPTKSYPKRWEGPGGKVEPGERLEEALARELREELGVDARIGLMLWSVALVATPTSEKTLVHVFEVSLCGSPEPRAAIGLGWFTADEFMHLRLAPANEALRQQIAERLAESEMTQPSPGVAIIFKHGSDR